MVIFLGFILTPVKADGTNDTSIQNISVQPYVIKVGDTFTVTATLVNNSTLPIIVDGGKCSAQDKQAEMFTMMFDNHTKNKPENINCAGVGWSEILDPGKNITETSPDYTANYAATESGTANVTVTFSYHAIIQRDPIQTGDEQTISKSFQFQIHDVNSDSSGPQMSIPKTISPLKQFKSGVKAEDVKCAPNLHLIIKAEDGSFACVSIETGKHLALRGWATTFGTGMIVNDYNISCNTAYPRSDSGIAVLYMPTNSVGKVCVRYHNLNNVPTIVGDRIFDADNIANNASDVTAWASTNTLQGNDNATIVYSIKTGNKTGFYGLSLTCGGIPLAVGYDANSTITASDFPWANHVFHCGVITYDYYIEGTKGIEVRYISDSSAGQIGK
jgi:hypothetical protein